MKRRLISGTVVAAVFLAGWLAGQQTKQQVVRQPKTIIHFVALKWKAGVSDADRQKAMDGLKAMASQVPGIKNVWLKTLRVQPQDFNAVYAIEFANQDAADDYRDHPAHKAWETEYLKIRENSISEQATN